MKKALFSLLRTSLCTIGYLYASSSTTQAQVTTDNTVNTQVTQNGNVAEITGGETRESNLFHSFQDFSIPTGSEASFLNADNISNIFSRVTGGNISNIDGLIQANGSASLFLINPAGIVFGEGARLDIGGSFYGSSASSILFEGGEFSAVDLDNPPLLTVNAPIGLGFRDEPGDIIANPGSVLAVESEQTLALIGGNITFDNAIATGAFLGTNSTIEIGGLTGAGIVSFQEDGRLVFPPDVARGDISLSNSSSLITASRGGGAIFVYAKDFNLATDSTIGSVVFLDLDTTRASSGDVIIDAQGDVAIDGANSETLTAVFNNIIDDTQGMGTGIGEAGNIEISGRNISIINGGSVTSTVSNPNQSENISEPNRSSTIILTAEENLLIADQNARFSSSVSNQILFGNGNGGAIELTAQNLLVRNGATVDSRIEILAEGDAGDIDLAVNNIVLTDGGQINATSFGGGDGGNINITADSISVDGSGDIILPDSLGDIILPDSLGDIILNDSLGDIISANNITSPSRISSSIQPDRNNTINDNVGGGEAGDINISTSSLAITNGAEVLATSSGGGDGGSIEIVAREEIVIDGGVEQERTELGNDRGSFFDNLDGGNSGNIKIDTPTLKITNNGVVSSDTFNDENSGSIDINTQRLTVTNESLISASTFNRGNAGNLNIRTEESIEVNNDSVIDASTFGEATGSGGNLTIETSNLKVSNGSQINASTRNSGNAGNLTVRADSVLVTGSTETGPSAFQSTALEGDGSGGELNIFTQNLTISDGAVINIGNFSNSSNSSLSPGTGEPGNLNIQADSIALDNGRIDATTQSSIGNGANINIASEDIILDNNSSISARAFGEANGGNLTIDTQFIIAFPSIGEGNDLVADADRGTGGNITLNVDQLFGLQPGKAVNAERFLSNNTNDIDVSGNIDGNLSINASNVDPLRGSTELPRNVVQSQETSQQVCRASRETGAANGLNITGKGGVVPDPSLPLSSLNVTNNGETDATSAIPAPIETSQGKIQPARGIKVSKTGAITLTAYRTNNAGDRLPEIKPNCGG